MRAYLLTTGLLFLALVAAHLLRLVVEPQLARDPLFLLTTLLSVLVAAWAAVLFRRRDPR